MEDKTIKIVAAILGIVILDSVALFNGIDGTLFAVSIAAIAGMAGYQLAPQIKEAKKALK